MRNSRFLAYVLVVALAALALLASACGGGLGSDELPGEIGDGEREDIEHVFRDFLFGVNENNPQVASEVMLIPAELGIPEVQRMVIEISALDAEGIDVELQALGAAELDDAGESVHASATTNIGLLEADLVRREGEWRLASVPSLLPAPEFGGHHLVWEVTNHYLSSAGDRLTVVGRIANGGDGPVLQFGTPGYFTDAEGRTVITAQSAIVARPFVHSGEETYFRLDFVGEGLADLDIERFVLVPTFRPSFPVDEEVLADLTLEVDSAPPDSAPRAIEVLNGELVEARAVLITRVLDDDRRLLSVYTTPEIVIPPGDFAALAVPSLEEAVVAEATSLRFSVWGAVPRNQ